MDGRTGARSSRPTSIDRVLEAALEGEADVIVSGDRHLNDV
jgi:predicted nucleic acid-binding protein